MNIDLNIELNHHLWYSSMAKDFFEKYRNNTEEMTISFGGISSIARGFIQEYLEQKQKQNYKITDVDMPENIEKMFRVVKNPKPKPKLRKYLTPTPLKINV